MALLAFRSVRWSMNAQVYGERTFEGAVEGALLAHGWDRGAGRVRGQSADGDAAAALLGQERGIGRPGVLRQRDPGGLGRAEESGDRADRGGRAQDHRAGD